MPILDATFWFAALLAVLVAFGFAARALCDNPRNDPIYGIVHLIAWCYLRLLHKPVYSGLEHVPNADGKPTLFVCNHTAGLDPVLVHIASKHDVRWMMALDMRSPRFNWFWEWIRIIDVDRVEGDANSAREALRHLATGGSVGIFPEGGLERPPKQLIRFVPGVGLIIKKSKARVVPVVIEDTPQVDPAFASLWHKSRSRVTFYEPIDYTATDLSAKQITEDLFGRFSRWTGWPVNERPTETLSEVA
ncbi:MAG: hypothetical protein Phyf2KO_17740 [Phycisphaerales bacterium]